MSCIYRLNTGSSNCSKSNAQSMRTSVTGANGISTGRLVGLLTATSLECTPTDSYLLSFQRCASARSHTFPHTCGASHPLRSTWTASSSSSTWRSPLSLSLSLSLAMLDFWTVTLLTIPNELGSTFQGSLTTSPLNLERGVNTLQLISGSEVQLIYGKEERRLSRRSLWRRQTNCSLSNDPP
jgi:hypothetical protein